MREIQNDSEVTIESFDSDIEVRAAELAAPIHVRFFIRGLSGSLRLRFPKISYKKEPTSVEAQARIFYRLVDTTEKSILDADYYTHLPRSLDELDITLGLFPDMVDLTPYREVLTSESARAEFIQRLDPEAPWQEWLPHLRALDELIMADMVKQHVIGLLKALAKGDPSRALRLIETSQDETRLNRFGALVARAVAGELPTIPAELRGRAEESVLSWAVASEDESWDIDPVTGVISALDFRWQLEDLSLDLIAIVLWKLLGVLHGRLNSSTGSVGPLLEKYSWCVGQAKGLPPNHFKAQAALRLLAAGRVPQSVRDGAKVLREPVDNLAALEDGLLAQFGLPVWPHLAASRQGDQVHVSNTGIGAAIELVVRPADCLFADDEDPISADVLAGDSATFAIAASVRAVDAEFEKYGRRHRVTLEIAAKSVGADTIKSAGTRSIPVAISRKRRAAQQEYRQSIDPSGIVVGFSFALMEVFENIYYANSMDDCRAVLILGEPGVGKSHIARLLHESSSRAPKPFKVANAGGGGGDINIQRGEWIGYGKGHGIQGVDSKGRPGHLISVDGGTLFVDEFATMSQDLQVIFLSVLEGRTVEKIGGEPATPDVRCIFATNADVDEAVAAGTLRRDLVDRIGITFCIPPLRDRRGDILILAKHFASDHEIKPQRCINRQASGYAAAGSLLRISSNLFFCD